MSDGTDGEREFQYCFKYSIHGCVFLVEYAPWWGGRMCVESMPESMHPYLARYQVMIAHLCADLGCISRLRVDADIFSDVSQQTLTGLYSTRTNFVCSFLSEARMLGLMPDKLVEYGYRIQDELGRRQKEHYSKQSVDEYKRNRQIGYVYVVRAEGTGLYKIGKSIAPNRRKKSLQAGSPYRLSEPIVTFRCEDVFNAESSLKLRFSHRNTYGEWFDLTTADVDYIIHLSRTQTGSMKEATIGRYTEPQLSWADDHDMLFDELTGYEITA